MIAVHGQRFTGQGLFRFALVNTTNNIYLWTNDGSTPPPPNPPTNAVTLTVINGVYNIQLGDASITNMTPILPTVFTNNDTVALRIWFDDGINGLHLLDPDQQITAVPFAQHSATINDNAITSPKIADGAVTSAKIQDETITTADLANNAVDTAKIQDATVSAADLATNSVDSDEILNNAVTSAKIASDAASLDRVSGGTMSSVAGNIGIGTANPLNRLHVFANGGDLLNLETPLPSGQSGVSMAFTRMGSVKKRFELTANDDLSIFQGNGGNDTVANRTFMTLNSNTGDTVFGGNVGIGTTAPEAKLDVDGEIKGFGIVPIGTILPWHQNAVAPALALPVGWTLCNGVNLQVQPFGVLDPDGDGHYTPPNLNGEGRFLRGGSSSGTAQNATSIPVISEFSAGAIFIGNQGNTAIPPWSDADGVIESSPPGRRTIVMSGNDPANPRVRAVRTRSINMSVVWIMRVR